MQREKYVTRFKEILNQMAVITDAKGKDYAGEDNVFRNFEFIEHITEGRVSALDGILVRMSDKFMRAANLMTRTNAVADEKVTDTLLDLAVYSIILKIILEKRTGFKPAPEVAAEQVAPLTPEEAKHILMTELNQKGSLTPAKRTLLQMLNLERAA